MAQAVDTAVAGGVAVFTSAGNSARLSYESGFSASSGGSPIPGAHDFDSGAGEDVFQQITIPEQATVIIAFQWNQPFASVCSPACTGAVSDLDICLYDAAGTTRKDRKQFDHLMLPLE